MTEREKTIGDTVAPITRPQPLNNFRFALLGLFCAVMTAIVGLMIVYDGNPPPFITPAVIVGSAIVVFVLMSRTKRE